MKLPRRNSIFYALPLYMVWSVKSVCAFRKIRISLLYAKKSVFDMNFMQHYHNKKYFFSHP
jgi:hypothetical protein